MTGSARECPYGIHSDSPPGGRRRRFTVYAYFSDGTVHLADIKPLIQRGGVFERLGQRPFFEERLTVMNGAVAWDVTGDRDETRCVDLDPWAMYENTPVVADPLA